jgi:uncharacterized membrane protein
MKNKIQWLLAVIIITAISHFCIIGGIPYYIMYQFGKTTQIKDNTISHAPPVTAKSRSVVRPSPDLLYSSCRYNVSKKPLHISSPAPTDTYFSLSVFADNTDNFFVINNRQIKNNKVDLVLALKGAKLPKDLKTANVIISPSAHGVILFRTLIKNKESIEFTINSQKKATCVPLVDRE